jgi:tetratricopeptide (TPR) repeat protein
VQQTLNIDLLDAETNLSLAMDIYQEREYVSGVGDCWNGIAEVHRHRGDLAAAEDAYRSAHKYLSRHGAVRAIVPTVNRGLIRLQRDDYGEAAAIFEEGLRVLDGSHREILEVYCHLGLLPCLAHRHEWHRFDHHLSEAQRVLTKTGVADRDLAWPTERGGDKAVAEGERERAEAAWRLAMDQWQRIGALDQANRLSKRLGKTPT